MEKLIAYLWRNVKYACKTVFSKFREYMPFFVALFIIQTIFFTVFITTATNYQNRYDKIHEEYDYDILIDGLTYNQYLSVDDRLYIMSYMKKRPFESYRIAKVSDSNGDTYRIYVEMRDGESNEDFLNYYVNADPELASANNIEVTYTPLNEYRNSSEGKQKVPSIPLLAVMTLISVGALLSLYVIRVNHDRFRYGIYSSFGAGFKRLFSTCIFEMMVVAFLALPFAAGFAYGMASLFYGQNSVNAILDASSFIKVFIMDLVVVALGVFIPMKSVSKTTPMSLITAQDNSNLVSSPRGTRFMEGSYFLRIYEMMGMWRFRKYYLKLLVSAVAFSAIFICGIYVTDMKGASLNENIEEFRLESKVSESQIGQTEESYNSYISVLDRFCDTFSELDGVSYVDYEVSKHATEAGSVLLLEKGMVTLASGEVANVGNVNNPDFNVRRNFSKYLTGGYVSAMNSYEYKALDKNALRELEENYEIEGDIYSVLNDARTVVISEDVLNVKKYDFNVGDKIVVAKIVEASDKLEIIDPFDQIGVLESMMSAHVYEFEEYTVGAVVKAMPESAGDLMVGMSYAGYELATGELAIPMGVSVYLDGDVSAEQYEAVALKAKQVINNYSDSFILRDTYGYLYRTIDREKMTNEFGIMLSLLILLLSPIVWFYSQSLFYKKRRNEMYVLSAYGATAKVFKKIHMTSGLLLSAAGFVFTVVLSLGANYLIFKTMNEWIVYLGFGSGVRYEMKVSVPALILCLAVSVLCGFISSYLPYRSTVKNGNRKQKKLKKDNDGNEKEIEIEGDI